MNYLTNYYKNRCEQLKEKINNLEKLLEYSETETSPAWPPPYTPTNPPTLPWPPQHYPEWDYPFDWRRYYPELYPDVPRRPISPPRWPEPSVNPEYRNKPKP